MDLHRVVMVVVPLRVFLLLPSSSLVQHNTTVLPLPLPPLLFIPHSLLSIAPSTGADHGLPDTELGAGARPLFYLHSKVRACSRVPVKFSQSVLGKSGQR